MFEGVVSTVLNKFLGDYVANLETNQLKLGIFSGHLGKLELYIPWRNLKTQPVTVLIEDLFLLAGPRIEASYDRATEEEREQRAKQEKLETAELFAASVENQLSDDIHQESFTTQLVTKIVDNLQVTVKNIHIRFEDNSSNPNRLFSIGLTLKSLTAVSTDKDWKESFIVNPQDAVNKLVKLDSFAVYWNTRESSLRKLTFEEFIKESKARISDESNSYILNPVSGVGKATLNKFLKEGIPKTMLDIFFDAFALNVNYEQYFDILSVLASLSAAQRALPYRKFRPTGDNVSMADLFRYAGTCFKSDIHERNKRRSWTFVMARRADRKEYINLYSNKLILTKLNDHDAERLKVLERRTEFEDILHYRALGRAFARKSQTTSPTGAPSKIWGWLGYKASAATNLVKEEDIKELYETIDFDANNPTSSDNIDPTAQMLKVKFKLGEVSVSISESPVIKEAMVTLLGSILSAEFIQRPKTIGFSLSLKDLTVLENLTEKSLFRELVKVKPARAGSPTLEKPLLFFSFDQLTKNESADADVRLELRPLLIVANVSAADKLASFLLNLQTKALIEALKAEAKMKINDFGVKTRANFQRALEEHKGMDLKVNIDAPIIMIPEDPTDMTKSIFALDMGKLVANSVLVSPDTKKAMAQKRQLTEEERDDLQDLLYDKIEIRLSQFGAYFAENVPEWWKIANREIDATVDVRNKIIDEIDIEVVVENSILPSAANLAKTKISGFLPDISVYVSDWKIAKAMKILALLSKPPEEKPIPVKKTKSPRPQKRSEKGKKPAVEIPPSDHDDEEFFDAFEDMKLKDKEPSTTIQAEFVEEPDPLNLSVHFTIGRIFVQVSKNDKTPSDDLKISFLAEDMGLDMTGYGMLMDIGFHIGGFGIREHFSSSAGELVINGDAESATTDLLNVHVQIVNPENKDFSALYRKVERSIGIKLSSIRVYLEPSRLLNMAEFVFKDILPALETEEAAKVTTVDQHATALAASDLIAAYEAKTELSFQFLEFSVFILDSTKKAAQLTMDTMDVSIELAGKRFAVKGNVSALELTSFCGFDSSQGCKLIYFDGGSTAYFGFETNCAGSDLYVAGSNIVRLNTGQLCINYEPQDLINLAATANQFLKIIDVVGDGKKTEKVSKEKITDDVKQPVDIKSILNYLDIDLQSPVVKIPLEDRSCILSFFLGRLQVRNSFEFVEKDLYDQILSLVLADICVSLSGEQSAERFLLNRFAIPLSLRMTANAMARKYADVEIDGTLLDIILEMSEKDLGTILKIATEVSISVNRVLAALPSGAEQVRKAQEAAAADKKELDRPKEEAVTEDKFPLDAKLKVKSLQLHLKDEKDVTRVNMAICGVSVTAVSHSIRGLGVEVAVESLSIADEGNPDQHFKELVLVGKSASEYNNALIDEKLQMMFRMDKAINGEMVVNVYLESPRVFLLYDTIFYMQKFFLNNLPKSPPQKVAERDHSVAVNTAKSDFTLLFNLVDATVIVVENCMTEVTEAVALTIGGVSVKIDQNMAVLVEKVSVYIFNTDSPSETKVSVFDDFSGFVKMGNTVEPKSSLLEVSCDPIHISISFNDIQLIQSLVAKITEAKDKYAVAQEIPSTLSSSSISSSSSSSASPIMEGVPEQHTSKAFSETGSVILNSIRIIVIDDSGSAILPLLDLNVDNFACSIENWSSELKVQLSARLSSNCYNPTISYWEPMIEPWKFNVTVGPSEVEPNADSVVMLSSESGLDILAVHHSLERILQMVQKLGSKTRSSTASRALASPYIIYNYLDCDVSVSGSLTDQDKVEVKVDEKVNYSFEDWQAIRGAGSAKTHSLCLFFDHFKPVSHLSLDRDGYVSVSLRTIEEIEEGEEEKEEKVPRQFFMHTFLTEGVRNVHLREKIMIHNETDQQLCLNFNVEGKSTTKALGPQSCCCIPSWCASLPCQVSNTNAGISQELIFSEGLKLNGKIISFKTDDEKSMHLLMSCTKPSLENIWDFKISAPMVFQNLLPSNGKFQLTQNGRRTLRDIAENELVDIYDVDPSQPCTLAFSLPDSGLFSTNECEISGRKDHLELAVQNEEGLELKVLLTKDATENLSTLLCVSAHYVLVNQTEFTIQVQSEATFKDKKAIGQVFSIPPHEDGKPMVMFSHPNQKNVKNRARIRVADSNWSDPVSFEAVGAELELNCKSLLTSKWYNLGGFVGLGQGKYAVTKVVYISPRYILVNDTLLSLVIGDSEVTFTVPPKSQIPVNFNPSNVECIAFKESGAASWCSSFDIRNTGNIYIRDDPAQRLFRVSRVMKSPNLFISISLTTSWPFVIRNRSLRTLSLKQKNVDISYICEPSSEMKYAWDQPSFSDKLAVLSMEDKEFSVDLAEVGKKSHFKLKGDEGSAEFVDVEIKAEGPLVVILVNERVRRASEAANLLNPEAPQAGYVEVFKSVTLVRIPHISLSLIGADLEEFLLIYVGGLEIRLADSKEFTSYGFTLKWMQIDNQSFDWLHPMLLFPTVLSKTAKDLDEHPFLSLGIIQSKDTSYGVTYYKYFGLLLQEISLEMGEELLHRILSFVNLSILSADATTIVPEDDLKLQKFEAGRDSSDLLFFEFFQMHPIKANLTFSRTEEAENDTKKTKTALQETVMGHYKQEALSQVHKILGSADFLGNPVGLVSTLGSGVTDLFYEPYQGFVSDRPQDIGIGFARGGLSLAKKTVSGLSGTLSKFTGSLAKGLSAATMDKSFQKQRRTSHARNKPKHALSGVSTGVLELYTGFKSGITGVVDKPLAGAKEGGVGGFFKGVGVGLVGVVTKPVVGLIDMTTSLTEGIKNSADDNPNDVSQVRFPRVMPWDQKLLAYNPREAFGQSVLINIIGSNLAGQEFYVAHVEIPIDNAIVLVSNRRLIYASILNLKMAWQVDIKLIRSVRSTTDCVVIVVSEDPPRTKVIPIEDKETQKWFSNVLLKVADAIILPS